MKKKEQEMEFPECWEEVRANEWMYILKLRERLMEGKGYSLKDIKHEWCRYVLQNRGVRGKNKQEYYLLIYNLALTLEWMWLEEEEGKSVELTYDCTENLLPEWRNLRGPLSHGSDLTFGEFRTAVTVMNEYVESQDAGALQALCGILYRKPGKRVGKADFDGRYREPFSQARIPLYAARVRYMPSYLQFGVYAWFAYFCKALMEETFIVDGQEICFAPVFGKPTGESRGAEQSIGMNAILFSVAESGIFGNVNDTDDTLLFKVMMKLLDDYQRAKELTSKR